MEKITNVYVPPVPDRVLIKAGVVQSVYADKDHKTLYGHQLSGNFMDEQIFLNNHKRHLQQEGKKMHARYVGEDPSIQPIFIDNLDSAAPFVYGSNLPYKPKLRHE